MNELQRYARHITHIHGLRYNPDDTIEALPEQLQELKDARDEINRFSLEIGCSDMKFIMFWLTSKIT